MTAEHDDRLMLTVTEAAQAVGVDRRTIRRRLDSGDFPHAHREPGRQGPGTGPWLIPVDDLLGAGLIVREPGPSDAVEENAEQSAAEEVLRLALADALRRAEVAEARAAERERVIEAQELALRTLMAGAASTESEGDSPAQPAGTAPPSPRSPVAVARDDQPTTSPAGSEGPRTGEPSPRARVRVEETVPPAAQPYPEPAPRPAPKISPGAPRKPTPPWVPIENPPARRRWWQPKH
jgi:hypothetical protein